jgi:hypothetical protein
MVSLAFVHLGVGVSWLVCFGNYLIGFVDDYSACFVAGFFVFARNGLVVFK